MHPAHFTEYVAAYDRTDGPATPGGFVRRLRHAQRGEDLVHSPAETILVSTKCSVPSSVDVPVHRHGVSIVLTCSFLFPVSHCARLYSPVVNYAGLAPT